MTTASFTVANSTALAAIPQGASIHVIGVCGVAMAQIAVALSEKGYRVSGSDKEFYEPMKSFLAVSSVKTMPGFSADNIGSDVALVVIGNSISYGNPEVAAVEERKLSYTFFPKLLSETVIADRHSIAVCGTHGKTTTTAMVATLLLSSGRKPSYFIGGAVKGIPKSLEIGEGSVSVVEGDEYDSAFFAKVPKFFFYKPGTAIITSIEYDHADIYPSLDSIIEVFTRMVSEIPSGGRVICCHDCPTVRQLVPAWEKSVQAEIVTYGVHAESDVRITERTFEGKLQKVQFQYQGSRAEICVPAMGLHNARNAVSAYLASLHAGLSGNEAAKAFLQFKGVRRRQDLRVDGAVLVIEDFAHHPTAVEETLKAVAEQYGGRRRIAVFEPRSNTSRRKVFQEAYVRSFHAANEVVLCDVTARASDAGVALMDVSELSSAVAATGIPCQVLPDADAICRYCVSIQRPGDIFVVMSNGSFGGLLEKLEAQLAPRS